MKVKLERKLNNVERALIQLREFLDIRTPSRVEIAGGIQGFEFTFETFWKCFRAYAEHQGVMTDSPRSSIAFAFQNRVITEEKCWLDMIKDRNETSHVYNEGVATGIYGRVKTRYLAEFESVFIKLRQLIDEPGL
jgi:nucleotidyltransferase substrate binding protein (TIGR01987 family)